MNKDHINNSFAEAAKLSQVTPHSRIGKLKDKLLFGGLVCIALIIASVSFIPGKIKLNIDQIEENNINNDNHTLVQNLNLIEQMKKGSLSLQNNLNNMINPVASQESTGQEILARMNAPTTFFNNSKITAQSSKYAANKINNNLVSKDSQLTNQQDEISTVSAKRLPHPQLTVPAGELIPATLETAINSDLPGMVRAITSRDIYSLENGNLLIPKGATLVGQFNAGIVQGQSRLLVIWSRIQMTNGIIVTLNSPGTDTLGRSGLAANSIDRHFLERFGSSALLSILGAYTANNNVSSTDQYNSKAQYRMVMANSFQQTASQTLEQDMVIKPTLQINQGTPINVFVAHDLDFHGIGKQN